MEQNSRKQRATEHRRWQELRQLESWLEGPVVVLSFIWILLLIVELVWGENRISEVLGTLIWVILLIDFGIRLLLAPQKGTYLRHNWLSAISLMLPALRVFSIFRLARLARLARVGRGVRLVRVIGSINRSMLGLKASMQRRGFGYVAALTLLVTLVGAAGMLAFEQNVPGQNGFATYGDTLWWTAMIVTTLGSAAWPVTTEGRILGFILSLYAFGVFGYITASLASFFVGREAEDKEGDLPSAVSVEALRQEIRALRREVREMGTR